MESASTDLDSAGQLIKRKSACDECANKKLKCTGEHPQCRRCVRESIPCVYSVQKTMGRPKKRLRFDDDTLIPNTNRWLGSATQEQTPALGGSGREEHVMNIGQYESTFTQGGGMQPGLQTHADWYDDYSLPEGAYGHLHGVNEHNLPELTSDNSSSYSPPTINVPPELQLHLGNSLPYDQANQYDSSTASLLDPALTGPMGGMSMTPGTGSDPSCNPTVTPDCACLSSMYLTMNTLQGMDSTFTFPFSLHPLREAMQTADSVLGCKVCPTRFITGLQNTQLIGTLLMSIAERFSKVLEQISAECVRASAAGERKKFRLADLNSSSSHLHTGGLGCAAAFSLDLSPEEWKTLCKKVVRAEVHGPESGNDCCCYLIGLFDLMEKRQKRWHEKPVSNHFPRNERWEPVACRRGIASQEGEEDNVQAEGHSQVKMGDSLCLRLVVFARQLVDVFDWS